MLDPKFVVDFGDRWQDAVNRRAIDDLLALCQDDIRLKDPGLEGQASGRQAVRQLFTQTWSAFADLRFTRPDPPYLVAAESPVVVARWAAKGNMTGAIDPPGYAPTNAPVEFHGVDVWLFRDGLLADWEGIYDIAHIGRQIGALPPRGSGADRMGARLQRLAARRIRRRTKR